jgi:hypothetical protein
MDDKLTYFIAGATFAVTLMKVIAKILKDAKKK